MSPALCLGLIKFSILPNSDIALLTPISITFDKNAKASTKLLLPVPFAPAKTIKGETSFSSTFWILLNPLISK